MFPTNHLTQIHLAVSFQSSEVRRNCTYNKPASRAKQAPSLLFDSAKTPT
jgi:hypothetical protein